MQGIGAAFIDRDGVLIEDVHYLSEIGQLRLIPGAAEAVANLNAAGIPVVVVTNQSGVARGYFTEDRVMEVHQSITGLLAERGARVDRYYYCPHFPTAVVSQYRTDCDCRKPKPGMLTRAAAELGLDLARSYMVGDKTSDLAAGAAAGCKTILVRTGYGAGIVVPEPTNWNLMAIAADLHEAARYIVSDKAPARQKKALKSST